MSSKTLARKIKKLRMDHGVAQIDLAKGLGITQKTLSFWETGRVTPRKAQIQKLCDYFNCPIEEITKGEDFIVDIPFENILLALDELDTRELGILIQMASNRQETIKKLEVIEEVSL